MYEVVKCAECGAEITVEKKAYDSLLKQVRDKEFDKEVEKKMKELNEQKQLALDLEHSKYENMLKETVSEKDKEIETLKAKANQLFFEQKNKMNTLQKELVLKEEQQKRAVAKAQYEEQEKAKQKDVEIERLKQTIQNSEREKEFEIHKSVSKLEKKVVELETEKNEVEREAQLKLQNVESEARLKLQNVESEYEKKIAVLKADNLDITNQKILVEESLKSKYESMLSIKDEEIERYKEFKSKQSVKLLGETLEKHCSNEFEMIRPLMPDAYFEKDNEVSTQSGSKGDFIYRDYEDGMEYISVMIEAKNEADESVNKHKNADFFKELDKDRREKGCEYAILVTTLEPENELYNRGIVDVSNKYPKMLVVRPQFFIVVLILLRNAARNTIDYKKALEKAEKQNIDVFTFEEDLEEYKEAVANSFELAVKKKKGAIEKIDKAINLLQKIKEEFAIFERHMETAEKKAEKLTIKKLTANAPTVREMLEECSGKEEKELCEITSIAG